MSRHVSALESEGEVGKARLGRENLVYLNGHEPTAARMPEFEQSSSA